MKGQSYESHPLIQFEERHGGPYWFNLIVFKLQFHNQDRFTISLDDRMSKRMTDYPGRVQTITGRYKVSIHESGWIKGRLILDDQTEILFESFHKHHDFLFLIEPPFWKESVIVKRVE